MASIPGPSSTAGCPASKVQYEKRKAQIESRRHSCFCSAASIRPRLRLEHLRRERFQVHRFVVESVVFLEPQGVLQPVDVIALAKVGAVVRPARLTLLSRCLWNRCPGGHGITVQVLVESVSKWSWNTQIGGGLAEHQQVCQRIGTQAVGAMHRCAGTFARCIESGHCLLLSVSRNDHLAMVVGRDTTHLVVRRGHNRNRSQDRVFAGAFPFVRSGRACASRRPGAGPCSAGNLAS